MNTYLSSCGRSGLFSAFSFIFLALLAVTFTADAAVSRDGPDINGLLEGDLYQLEADSVNVNSGARIEGTWYLPGTPTLQIQGGTLASGDIFQGDGDIQPSGYTVRLQNKSYVEAIVNRTLLTDLPLASSVVPSAGNRIVHIIGSGDVVGDSSTLQELHINANNVDVPLPAGNYDKLSVNGKSRLILGTSGATVPEVYNVGQLHLNTKSRLEVVGPIVLRLKNQFNPNAAAGNEAHPEWLRIEMASGGMNINSKAKIYAVVICPSNSVHINGLLEGALYADKIKVNSMGIYRERASIYPPEIGNNAPVANPVSFDSPEDEVLSEILTGSDADGDTLVFSILTPPDNGTATLSEAGELIYEPEENFFGSDSLVFQVFDGEDASEPATVQLNVLPVNDAPEAYIEPFSVLEDTPTSIIINIEDVDSSSFTLRVDAVSGGSLGGAIGNLTFTPDSNYSGSASFTLAILDGDGGEAILSEDFIVGEVNDAPVPTNTAFTTDEDVSFSVLLEASDIEGEALAFSLVEEPAHGSAVVLADGTLDYTPEADFNGVDILKASVEDASGALVVYDVTVTVNPINDAPRAVDQSFGLLEDGVLNQIVVAVDIEEDPFTFFLSEAPTNGSAVVEPDGSFVYSPHANYNGPDQIGVTVSDDVGAQTDFLILLTIDPVNDAPVAETSSWSVNEDSTLTGQLSGSDIDGDALAYAVEAASTNGALSVNADGSFTYLPNANYNGGDSFSFTVSDSQETSEAAAVSILVDPINDTPEVSDQSFETDEDIQLQASLSALDVDGDTLSFALEATPLHGTVVVDANGAFTYDPEPEYSGVDGFSVSVSDGSETVFFNVGISVLSANDAPIASDLNFTLSEDSSYSDSLVATDIDGDALEYSVLGIPTNGILKTSAGAVISVGDLPFDLVNADFIYVPDLNFNGGDSFTYVASDGELASSVATVTLQITPVNDAPVALSASENIDEDTILAGVLSASDVDLDPLSYSLTVSPSNGSATVNPDGTYSYTPNADFNGSDSFSFVVTDGVEVSTSAVVNFTVIAANDTPVAIPQSLSLDEDNLLPIVLSGSDLDGDSLIFTVTAQPANGVLSGTTPNLTYTPNENFFGTDSFSFTVADAELMSASAEVALTITAVNDAPVAVEQSFTTQEDLQLVDALVASDVDGDALSFALDQDVANGTLALASDGTFTYAPTSNFNGSDSFTFMVSDGNASSVPSLASIIVQPVNDAPLIEIADSFSAEANIPLFLDADITDDGAAGSSLEVLWSLVSGSGGINFSNQNEGATFATFDTPGTYTISIHVSDGELFTEAQIEVTVTGNAAPRIVSSPLTDLALLQGPLVSTGPALLEAWTELRFPEVTTGGSSVPNWQVSEDGLSVTQLGNSLPSGFLSNFNLKDASVSGSFLVSFDGDDDGIGFIFGFQDTEHFYIFNWRRGDQGGVWERGMNVRRVNSDVPLVDDDLAVSAGSDDARVVRLYQNDIPWGVNVEYHFELIHLSDRFTITIREGSQILDSFTIRDDTYPSGGFGFYNRSQDSVKYQINDLGYEVLGNYSYDVEATDTDGDQLDYSLVHAPDFLEIDSATGLITGSATETDIGNYDLRIQVIDGNGGFDFQDFILKVSVNQAPAAFLDVVEPVINLNQGAQLSAVILDDGIPAPSQIQINWQQTGGPSAATILSPDQATSAVNFTERGLYRFELEVSDGLATTTEEVLVDVEPQCEIIVADDVVAWWTADFIKQDETSGKEMILSGGAEYVNGLSGAALHFDGEYATAHIPAFSGSDLGAFADGHTIEFWVYMDQANDPNILSWGDQVRVRLRTANSSPREPLVEWIYTFDDGTSSVLNARPLVSAVDRWMHVALVYDRSTGDGYIYADGILIGSGVLGTGRMLTESDLTIASRRANEYFDGRLDELTFYSRPLTYDEIYEVYSAGSTGKCPSESNQQPLVNAGADHTISDPAATYDLAGTATDNVFGGAPLALSWEVLYGPGTVTFSDVTSPTSTVSFAASGRYLLRLHASDGVWHTYDDVAIEVGTNVPPVEIDANQAIWWSGDNTFHDSASGIELLPYGALQFTEGQVFGAFDFDGVNDQMCTEITDNLDLGNSATGLSIEFWLNFRTYQERPYLMGWDNEVFVRLTRSSNASPRLEFFGRADDQSTIGWNTGNLSFNTINKWLHVAVVYDRINGLLKFYIDGSLVSTGSVSSVRLDTSGRLCIGGNGGVSPYFNGMLDEIGLYPRPLSDAEISSIYTTGSSGKTPKVENAPPTVDAGTDFSVSADTAIALQGQAFDDGLPVNRTLSTLWQQVSGPGNAVFADPLDLSTNVSFTLEGDYRIRLIADDGVFTSFDELSVTVDRQNVLPTVFLTQPTSSFSVEPGESLQLIATAIDTDGEVSSVEFFIDGTSLGLGSAAVNNEYFVGPVPFASAGTYQLTAVVTDNSGDSIASAPVQFQVLEDPGFDMNVRLESPSEGEVITSPVDVIGTVASSILSQWTLEYRLLGEVNWSTLDSSETTADNEFLAEFDPTLLLNGIYELRLTGSDTFGRSRSVQTVLTVDGDMKVGNFALAFEDLTVPMAGIPIQIIRSYDSRDTRMGDFGTGWSMAINDIRLRKNGALGNGWLQEQVAIALPGAGSTLSYCLEPTAKRLVSVTFPDGEQHLFEASVDVGHGRDDIEDFCQLFVPISEADIVLSPRGDTTSTLEVVGSSRVYTFAGIGSTELYVEDPAMNVGAAIYNPTQFILTTRDGTRYLIDEDDGLISMEDLNGNKLEVFDDRIVSTAIDPNGGADIVREVTFLRDGEGRITTITDPDGKTLDYAYSQVVDGELVESSGLRTFTNRVDETTEFVYADSRFPDYLTDILDPRGIQAIRTEYDEEGRIARQIDADGNPIDFDHDLDAFAETVTDRLGNPTTYYYDDLGNVTRQVDALGAETLFEYYPGTTLVKYETDDLGNVTSRAYDAEENLLVEVTGASIVEDPLTATTGFITRYTYNEFSSPLSITDPNGNLTEFTYDGKGNLLSQIQYGYGGETLVTGFTYRANGDIASITDAEGNVTSYTYNYGITDPEFPDAVKRQATFVSDATLGVLRVTESLYDQQENLLAERYNRTLASGGTEVVQTSYLYDEENRLAVTILPDGQVAETRYNNIGKEAASIRWQSIADYQSDNLALARVTSMDYDDRGNLIRTDYPDGTFTRMGYNLEGRMIWSTNQLGEVTAMAYNALGRQTHTVMAAPGDPDADALAALNWNIYAEMPATLQDNPTSESIYDSIGRVEFTIDAVGNLTQNIYDDNCACAGRLKETRSFPDPNDMGIYLSTSYIYDENGNQRFVTDPKGNITEFIYDDYNRLVQTNHPSTAEHGATNSQTIYDALGRRVATVDEEGKRTEFSYDALGRLIEVRQEHPTENWSTGNWTTTSYTYDEAGNLLTETDAEGNTTRFEYDNMGRRTKRVLAEDEEETYIYNDWGELESRTDFNGHTTTYTYDDLSRLLTELPDATAFPTEVGITYTYDALGRIETMVDASGTTTHVYDERGNLTSKTNAAGTLTYTYDAANNLKSTVSGSAGGLDVAYDYDGLNRLDTVTDSGAAQPPLEHSYSYDANGNLETLTYSNGVTHTWSYDARNRLKNLSIQDSLSSTLNTYVYELKASGHRSKINEAGGRVVNYTYDNLYRLTQESISGDGNASLNGTSDWDYDLVGNRLSQNSTIDQILNVAESYSGNNWLDSHTYDSNGNTAASSSYEEPAITLNDSYDWRNRLVRREKSDGTIIEITYDGFGDRIRKSITPPASSIPDHVWFLVDRNNLTGYAQVVEEIEQGGDIQAIYTYGLDLISQDRRDDDGSGNFTQSFYLYDGLGSVRALADSTGAVTDTYIYDAWGVLLEATTNQQQATTNAYRFTGEQWDEDLEMYFLRARYLNTSTGRFHTMDTFEGVATDPVTLHKYLYANANPASYLDPTGNFSIRSLALTTAVIGTIVTMANVAITGTFAYRVATGGSAIPDGMMVTGGGTFGARGAIAEINFHLAALGGSTWAGWTGEAGLDPTTLGKRNKGSGFNFSFSFLFGAKDISDLSGVGFTATWPVSVVHLMPRALLKALSGSPHNMKNIANILIALKRGKRQGGHRGSIKNPNFVVQFGLSGSSTAIMSFGARSNTFSTTLGFTSSFREVAQLGPQDGFLNSMYSQYGSLLQKKNAFANDPYLMANYF